MEIKTSLKQLTTFFAQSAATEELTVPVRRFAAQLTILSAHMQRIEATAKRVTEDLEKRLVAIEALFMAAQQASAPTAQAAPGGPPEQAQPDEGASEEDEAEAMAAKVQAETEAELAAITNGAAEPEIVVVPAARKNGGKKAPQAGGAA